MLQDWVTLTFIHWPYQPQLVRPFIPPGLELDTFDGNAWIGLTPFRVVNLRPPKLPSAPWICHFPETNLRTYVRASSGEPGIWFFTLEAARILAVAGARSLYGLPYRWAKMRVEPAGDTIDYSSVRRSPGALAYNRLRIRTGHSILPSELETFLTARFRLYTLLHGKLSFADVEHEPWPLHKAEILQLDQSLTDSVGLPRPHLKPMAHFSPGVHVRIGRPQVTE